MGALPRSKAGVGSAVNDTTRQVGGALGVAIIGSVVSSVYSGRIAGLARRFELDDTAVGHAQASLGGAQRVGASLGQRSDEFVAGANQIFVDSMAVGMRISVGVILVAALMVWRFLPARASDYAAPSNQPDELERDLLERDLLERAGRAESTDAAVAPPATATPVGGG
jgi:hypothetical protein